MHPSEDDERHRRVMFDRVWELLQQQAAEDPALRNVDRRPAMFSLSRNGHALICVLGRGNRIADGEIHWKPNPDGDQPHRFRVVRSAKNSEQYQFDQEDAVDLDTVARRIVQEYLHGSDLEGRG